MEYYWAIKKEWNWVICRDVDGPRDCYIEWNKSEREKPILYVNAYIWNLETWYRCSYSSEKQPLSLPPSLCVSVSVIPNSGKRHQSVHVLKNWHFHLIARKDLSLEAGSPATEQSLEMFAAWTYPLIAASWEKLSQNHKTNSKFLSHMNCEIMWLFSASVF